MATNRDWKTRTEKGTSKKFNQEGIRWKTRRRPNSPIKTWKSKDDDYVSHFNFGKMIVTELDRELGDKGYYFNQTKNCGKQFIVCKKEKLLTGFYVPTMRKSQYRDFILQLAEKLVINYNATLE